MGHAVKLPLYTPKSVGFHPPVVACQATRKLWTRFQMLRLGLVCAH
jgi:hypothetical protein